MPTVGVTVDSFRCGASAGRKVIDALLNAGPVRRVLASLTVRECEVLARTSERATNEQIAGLLALSAPTLECQSSSISVNRGEATAPLGGGGPVG